MLILNKSNQSLNLCSKKHPPSLGKKLLSGENMEETSRGATEEESQKSTDSLFMLSPPQSAVRVNNIQSFKYFQYCCYTQSEQQLRVAAIIIILKRSQSQ